MNATLEGEMRTCKVSVGFGWHWKPKGWWLAAQTTKTSRHLFQEDGTHVYSIMEIEEVLVIHDRKERKNQNAQDDQNDQVLLSHLSPSPDFLIS